MRFPSLGQCHEASVFQQHSTQVCSKHGRSDLDLENILVTPNAVLFQLQESTPHDELYEVWHWKRIANGCSARYDMVSQDLVCISLNRPIAILDDMQVSAFVYADSNQYHQTT
ncbi:hypothetical protein TNCV_1879271 [Trichonephila clavipes]|nr:hypothetical protein TNCV_1879271 [Trichonephila clavipes]